MSAFGGGGSGGRTRMGTKVYLNVYDLSPMNQYTYMVGLGLHHSGVVVSGREYSYASGAGIFESEEPRQVPNAVFREEILLGVHEGSGSSSELSRVLSDLRETFRPDNYHLLHQNCNHFAAAFAWKLVQVPIPAHVNRLASMGACCSCLIPRSLLESAPVTPDSSTSSTGFTVKPAANRISNYKTSSSTTTTTPVFGGAGYSLGGGGNGGSVVHSSTMEREGLLSGLLRVNRQNAANNNSNSNKSSLSPQDDLTDRREKARKAALARLEMNSKQQS